MGDGSEGNKINKAALLRFVTMICIMIACALLTINLVHKRTVNAIQERSGQSVVTRFQVEDK
jgi:hypothetical protein